MNEMSLIYFPPIDRKTVMLLIFMGFTVLCYSVPQYFEGLPPYEVTLFDSLSPMFVSVPYLIRKFYLKKKIFKIKLSEYTKKDYIVFGVVVVIFLLSRTIYIMYDDTLTFIDNLCNKFNLNLFILIPLSYYALDNKYYKHHMIGHTIFTISAIVIDVYSVIYIIKDESINELYFNTSHILIALLDIIFDSIIYLYIKYLIDIKYLSPYIVSFLFGSIYLIYFFILSIFKLFNDCFIAFNEECIDLFNYIKNLHNSKINLFIPI